jgi:hypothetical protein
VDLQPEPRSPGGLGRIETLVRAADKGTALRASIHGLEQSLPLPNHAPIANLEMQNEMLPRAQSCETCVIGMWPETSAAQNAVSP